MKIDLSPATVIVRGTVKVVFALDKWRPFLSVAWNARFEPIFVTPPPRRGRVVARDGA